MNNKPFKIIITGGPGSGKTTLISRLNDMDYRTINESARTIIDVLKINPSKYRQKIIQKNQIFIENLIKNESGLFFLDQSLVDIGVYNKINNHENLDRKIIDRSRYFPHVFILKNLDKKIYPSNREESFEESKKIHHLIKNEYKKLGFIIVDVKNQSVEKRIDFIIKKINILIKKHE